MLFQSSLRALLTGLALALPVLTLACPALALASPLMAPHDVKVYSANKRFFVLSQVKQNCTGVFRASQPGKPVWQVPGYSSVPFVSDDGQMLAFTYPGGNILDHNVRGTDTLITFMSAAGNKAVLTVEQALGDIHQLTESSDGWVWGSALGFNPAGKLMIMLPNGHQTKLIDPASAHPVR